VKAWELWTGPIFGPHPVLLLSAQPRIDARKFVVLCKRTTMRPGQPFQVNALQATLDKEDGLELETRMNQYAAKRLQRWLWRKHGCQPALWKTNPRTVLRERYGLYRLPTRAAWTQARA
jgi:hypothetical protein